MRTDGNRRCWRRWMSLTPSSKADLASKMYSPRSERRSIPNIRMKRGTSCRVGGTIWVMSITACSATRTNHTLASSLWKTSRLELSGTGSVGRGNLRYEIPIQCQTLSKFCQLTSYQVHVYSQYQSVKVSSGCGPVYSGRIGGKFYDVTAQRNKGGHMKQYRLSEGRW